ncbi:MAG TPA: LuxR C-terminal-related transcriptional regulator [Acidimicrobiia bacterium]|nr:LuxR C-terminal-related transcriptional regulator [Acidimicrobiia bacterium]
MIAVIAPPGYGKTTLLSQWAEKSGRPIAWVSVDRGDNDPSVLLTYIAIALDRVAPLDADMLQAIGSPRTENAAWVVPRLASALASMSQPVSLVLDHIEDLESQQALDAIAELLVGLNSGSQIAIASRESPAIPMARLRARGQLEEVGVGDLAMDARESLELLTGAGVRLTADHAAELTRRTEGWPVGLYLAALAVRAGGDQVKVGFAFTGDDRFMADYVRSELLARLSTEEVEFLTQSAVLERMCGSLCDAVLGRKGSSRVLEELEERNLLVVPLDRQRQWYRYHHLFRDLLLTELAHREEEIVPLLHARAASWFEENGPTEMAVEHAQAAGDPDRVAALVLDVAQPVWATGRVDTVLRWMEWFEEHDLIDQYPAVAVHGALIFALLGQAGKCERWTASAERAAPEGSLVDGSTMESYFAYLRALLCRDGVVAMRRDARVSWDGLSPASPYRPTMLHTEALSYLLEDDAVRAAPILVRAFDGAMQTGALPLAAIILVDRCIAAIGNDEPLDTEQLTARAVSIVEEGRYDDYWTSALVYAWAAREALHRGDVARGREYLVRATLVRPLLTYALPVVSVRALLEMTRCYVALGDRDGARTVLNQVNEIVQQRPDLGVLPNQAAELRAQVEAIPIGKAGASSFTTAELRLLPLLPTHLSYREIGDRLFVSRHTVKTQAQSVYGKLGVSSRSEAVERVREIGLLGS